MKLSTNVRETAAITMHPALDFIGGVAYVAVNVVDEKGEVVTAIVSGEGEVWGPEEWAFEVRKRGFIPRAKNILLPEPRWMQSSVQELLDGTLTAPTWKATYDAIYKSLDDRLVVHDQRYITVLTLYAMMTYFHPLFNVLPILHLLGPQESGKSKAAILLAEVAFNGSVEGSPTPSSLFRSAHEGRYTQVLVETDHLSQLDSGDPFIRQLQSGTTKAEATVKLTETMSNKTFRPESYYTFNPKVLVSTKQFKAPTLRSRCIRLDINKTPHADERKLREPVGDNERWNGLRDMLYRLQLLKWRDVEAMRDTLRDTWKGPTGRTFDKFLPLAAMAGLVSREVLDTVKELAMEGLAEIKRDRSTTFEAIMYQFARQVVKDGNKKLTQAEIYQLFVDSPNPSSDTPIYRIEDICVPKWAIEVGLTTSISQLKKWVRDGAVLAHELSRLNLIPKEKEKQRSKMGYPYSFNKAHIDEIVELNLGPLEEDDTEQVA